MYDHTLDTFLCVAEKGSSSKAAASLFISPSAVVQQINALEGRVHATLFFRITHGVELTKAGKAFCDDARQIITLCRNAQKRLQINKRQIYVGSGRFNKTTLFQFCWNRLKDQLPDADIVFTDVGNFSVQNAPIDLMEGIQTNASESSVFSFLKLTETPFCIAVPSAHSLAEKECLAPKDLHGQTLLFIKRGISEEADCLRGVLRFPV